MKTRILAALLLLSSVAPSWAQLTQRQRTSWLATFTTNGYLGPIPFAADPVTCNTANKRVEYWNTVSSVPKICDGTAFRSLVLSGSTASADSVTSSMILDATIVNADISATADIVRSKLITETSAVYGIPAGRILSNAGAALTAAETAGTFDITVGTNTIVVNGEVTDNETEVSVAYFQFVMPEPYVAASSVTIRLPCALIKTGSPTNNGSTIDLEVYEQSDAGAVGSDLVSTSAATFAALDTWYTKDFVVDGAGLVAGDVLNVKITSSVVDSEAGAGTIILNLAPPKVLLSIKG